MSAVRRGSTWRRQRRRGQANVRAALLAIAVALVASGCGIFIIDKHQRALDFCEANRENDVLAEQPIDNTERIRYFSEDQAEFWSDEYSETMRYSEDSTRDLRKTARRLGDAYDDVREIADEDPADLPEEELLEKYGELREARIAVREACQPYLEELDAQAAANAEEDGE